MSDSKEWMYSTTIYEVNLRQYTAEGSFRAFARHLPRLKEMGVQTLWFMPITPISVKERKGSLGSYYACSDYTAVNPEFGTLDDFKSLVRTAHHQGFKVILDWVANHTGWDHVWTKEHPDWYEKDASTGNFKRASGMDDIIELDFRNRDMRQAVTEAMKFWVKECDIDGFRCDLAFWVELDYWLESIPQVNKLKPLFWLAEMDPLDHPGYMQVFDAAYSWAWMHKTAEWYRDQLPFDVLLQVLSRYLQAPGLQAWFTSNHDENSWNGTEYEKYGSAARLLAVHSFTWPGIPLVYSGQELPNHKRLQFFDKDPIQWSPHPELHQFYQILCHLKARHPALDSRAEIFRLPTSSDASILAYLRKKDEKELVVILNFAPHAIRFDLQANWIKGSGKEIFSGHQYDFTSQRNFELKEREYLVFEML